MSQQIVFFGKASKGSKWKLEGECGQGEVAYHIPSEVSRQPDRTSVEDIVNQVRSQLKSEPGLMITLDPLDNGRIKMGVESNLPKSTPSTAPDHFLLVGVDGKSRWKEVKNGSNADLGMYDSIVLPVSSAATQKLKTFVESIEDLPDDLRATMLFTLVLPTVETRLSRVEHFARSWRPGGGTGPVAGGHFGLWQAAATGLLAVALLGASLVLSSKLSALSAKIDAVQSSLK